MPRQKQWAYKWRELIEQNETSIDCHGVILCRLLWLPWCTCTCLVSPFRRCKASKWGCTRLTFAICSFSSPFTGSSMTKSLLSIAGEANARYCSVAATNNASGSGQCLTKEAGIANKRGQSVHLSFFWQLYSTVTQARLWGLAVPHRQKQAFVA